MGSQPVKPAKQAPSTEITIKPVGKWLGLYIKNVNIDIEKILLVVYMVMREILANREVAGLIVTLLRKRIVLYWMEDFDMYQTSITNDTKSLLSCDDLSPRPSRYRRNIININTAERIDHILHACHYDRDRTMDLLFEEIMFYAMPLFMCSNPYHPCQLTILYDKWQYLDIQMISNNLYDFLTNRGYTPHRNPSWTLITIHNRSIQFCRTGKQT